MRAQVHFHGLEASAAVRDAIDSKVAKLHDHHPDILGVEVTVQVAHRQQIRPELNVRVEVQLSGHMIVSEQADEDVYLALRDATNAARRQLGDLARRRREHSKVRIAEAVM